MRIGRKEKLLQNYPTLEYDIQNLNDRYEELYTASVKITPSYSDKGSFGGGFDGSKVENYCIKLLELELKRNELLELKKKIETELRKLTYHQREIVEFIAIEKHTIGEAKKHFRQTYSNTKVSFYNAIDKLDI